MVKTKSFMCKRCKKTFERTQSDTNRGRTSYCSRECSDAAKKESAQYRADYIIRLQRKQCKQCGQTKPLDEFGLSVQTRDGHAAYCLLCAREKGRIADEKRRDKRKELSRAAYLKRKYNISDNEYMAMYDKQFGMCAICCRGGNRDKPYFAVDHDHATGEIRGLLCNYCNLALGLFSDNKEYLEAAIMYLL